MVATALTKRQIPSPILNNWRIAMIHPKNYDQRTFRYWYRRLSRHPNAATSKLAEDYLQDVVLQLTYSSASPSIVWFEEAEQIIAKERWDRNHSKNAGPLDDSCEYFHRRERCSAIPDSKILLNINLHDQEDLLKNLAVAIYCYCGRSHVSPDVIEEEARDWLHRSEAQRIKRFLALWTARQAGSQEDDNTDIPLGAEA
jgi:hypothetical protein